MGLIGVISVCLLLPGLIKLFVLDNCNKANTCLIKLGLIDVIVVCLLWFVLNRGLLIVMLFVFNRL